MQRALLPIIVFLLSHPNSILGRPSLTLKATSPREVSEGNRFLKSQDLCENELERDGQRALTASNTQAAHGGASGLMESIASPADQPKDRGATGNAWKVNDPSDKLRVSPHRAYSRYLSSALDVLQAQEEEYEKMEKTLASLIARVEKDPGAKEHVEKAESKVSDNQVEGGVANNIKPELQALPDGKSTQDAPLSTPQQDKPTGVNSQTSTGAGPDLRKEGPFGKGKDVKNPLRISLRAPSNRGYADYVSDRLSKALNRLHSEEQKLEEALQHAERLLARAEHQDPATDALKENTLVASHSPKLQGGDAETKSHNAAGDKQDLV